MSERKPRPPTGATQKPAVKKSAMQVLAERGLDPDGQSARVLISFSGHTMSPLAVLDDDNNRRLLIFSEHSSSVVREIHSGIDCARDGIERVLGLKLQPRRHGRKTDDGEAERTAIAVLDECRGELQQLMLSLTRIRDVFAMPTSGRPAGRIRRILRWTTYGRTHGVRSLAAWDDDRAIAALLVYHRIESGALSKLTKRVATARADFPSQETSPNAR